LGLPLIVGLVSRRVTPRSVAVAVVVGVLLAIAFFLFLPPSVTIFGIIFEQEVIIFAVSFVTVMAIMFGMSAIWPMTAAESERAELFHKRLETPIGDMPEEREAAKHAEEAVSPFGIVGVCVACIGLLMLCVQPFIGERLPMVLNVILGLVLVTIGGSMAWLSRRSRLAKAALAGGRS
jgi:hypothetical protein